MSNYLGLSPEQKRKFVEAIRRFPQKRILVIGDLMLDVFIWGEVRRISPEAPVPVVEIREETMLLGGAANVVHNLRALEGRVYVTGLIGDDLPGRDLTELLRQIAVPTEGLIVEKNRPTTVKTRIIAHNQQVVRFDREQCFSIPEGSRRRALAYLEAHLKQLDAVIISDYGKGMITPEFMEGVRSLRLDGSVPLIVDPTVNHTDLYRNVTMITPNQIEASQMAGMEIHDEATLIEAGERLMNRLGCEMVLITRGKEGMSLFRQESQTTHIPTAARRVYDVTGAGDTVIATVTMGLVAGLSPVESAFLANVAAGIVVGEVGTATISSDRLAATIRNGALL